MKPDHDHGALQPLLLNVDVADACQNHVLQVDLDHHVDHHLMRLSLPSYMIDQALAHANPQKLAVRNLVPG